MGQKQKQTKRHQFSTGHLSHLPILHSQIEFADLIASLFRASKSSSVQFSLHFPSPHFTKTTLGEVTLRLSSHTLLLTIPFLKNFPSVCFSWQLLFPGFSSMPLVTLSRRHVQIPLLLLEFVGLHT